MPSKLNQLLDRRAELVREAKEVLARAYPKDSPPDESALRFYDRLQSQLVENEEALATEMTDRQALLNMAPEPHPDRVAAERVMPSGAQRMISRGVPQVVPYLDPTTRHRYAELFGPPAGSDGWRSLGEFAGAIWRQAADPRFLAAGMTEQVGSQGGFLVPPQFTAELMDSALEYEVIRPRARVEPMTSETKKVAGFDFRDNSTGTPAGISGAWIAEGGGITPGKAKTRLIEFAAKKLGLIIGSSSELVEDAASFEALLGQAIIRAIAWFYDEAFINGLGAGQPLGILRDPALIVQDKEGSQTGDTITFNNLKAMYARLAPNCQRRAVWLVHPSTVPELLGLTIGTGGNTWYPVMNEASGRYRIFGLDVLVSEHMAPLGDQGDIAICDLSQFIIAMRRDLRIDRSIHLGFTTDEVHFRAISRLDAMGSWGQAFQPKGSAPTLSWAVTLQAR